MLSCYSSPPPTSSSLFLVFLLEYKFELFTRNGNVMMWSGFETKATFPGSGFPCASIAINKQYLVSTNKQYKTIYIFNILNQVMNNEKLANANWFLKQICAYGNGIVTVYDSVKGVKLMDIAAHSRFIQAIDLHPAMSVVCQYLSPLSIFLLFVTSPLDLSFSCSDQLSWCESLLLTRYRSCNTSYLSSSCHFHPVLQPLFVFSSPTFFMLRSPYYDLGNGIQLQQSYPSNLSQTPSIPLIFIRPLSHSSLVSLSHPYSQFATVSDDSILHLWELTPTHDLLPIKSSTVKDSLLCGVQFCGESYSNVAVVAYDVAQIAVFTRWSCCFSFCFCWELHLCIYK